MAKKELLFYVIRQLIASQLVVGLMLYGNVAMGNEQTKAHSNVKGDDLEFAKELTKEARQIIMPQIKAKWLELKSMLARKEKEDEVISGFDFDPNWGTSFRIFVSSSMSKNLLKSYAEQAKKYGGVLVLNGLPKGSWWELSELITEVSGNNPELVAMQIDDEAFARFNIREVPSFLLSKEEDIFAENSKVTFDKVTGSVGIRRALELFKEQGELSDIASNKLEQAQINREISR
jgi:type-F conjugative transfer system pilin assembly protein TrbC